MPIMTDDSSRQLAILRLMTIGHADSSSLALVRIFCISVANGYDALILTFSRRAKGFVDRLSRCDRVCLVGNTKRSRFGRFLL